MIRKKSVVWDYFLDLDPNTNSVQCRLCSSVMLKPFSGGTTGMLRHLRVKHPTEAKAFMGEAHETSSISGDQDMETEVVVALEDEDFGTLVTEDGTEHDEVSIQPVRRLRSLIWRYFDDLASLDAARCRICKQKLQCCEGKSTSNLNRHLSVKHPEVFSQLVADRQNPATCDSAWDSGINGGTFIHSDGTTEQTPVEMALEDEEGSDEHPLRRQRSLIWNYFIRLDGLDAVRCRICMKEMNHSCHSTSNMRLHMSTKHPDVFFLQLAKRQNPQPSCSSEVSVDVALEDKEGNETDLNSALDTLLAAEQGGSTKQKMCKETSDEQPLRRQRSLIWKYFMHLDGLEAVRCCICLKELNYSCRSTSNMRRHMSTKHPEVFFLQLAKKQNPQPSCSPEVSVEVALEHEEGNDTDLNSALDTLLAAEQGGSANQLTSEAASDEQPLRRQRSLIWRHFKRLKCLTAVRCHICMKKLQYTGGSTSNMHRHMSSKHPDVFSQQLAKRPTLQQPLSSEVSEVAPDDEDSPPAGNDTDVSPAASSIRYTSVKQTKRKKTCDNRHATRQQRLIWSYFEHLDSLGAARCLVCMKKMRYVEGGSISSLRQHMAKRHPELLAQLVANGQNSAPAHSPSSSDVNGHSSTPSEADGMADDRLSPGERRLFRTEQNLIESLRRAQREEAQALEHQRELLEKLRAVNAREAAAERQQIESLRKVQLEEAKDLSRQKEELQKEKAELQKKREELRQEREELRMFAKPPDSLTR
ncbi:uncharacterized protein V6R79_004724 [Siganus canaliculatus]